MPERAGQRHIQYAALPWRHENGELQILLITSLKTKRWIIPKGWPEKSLLPEDSAAHEALEEAGVIGPVTTPPLGSYRYKKLRKTGEILPCEVHVYAMEVTDRKKNWREKRARQSQWCTLNEALAHVREAGLRRLILKFFKRASKA
ncbi:MAG: NUDIX hydrolase [Rhodospirillaceae bacterium]|nr:NUDIX hydrolase [Rhodospirillaceae bacterium]